MAKSKKSKTKNPLNWKSVDFSGVFQDGFQEFEGFAGLEVLENYDKSFLTGNTKQKVSLKISRNLTKFALTQVFCRILI